MSEQLFFDDVSFEPIHPVENPFDRELDKHIESLVKEDYPLEWYEQEGVFL